MFRWPSFARWKEEGLFGSKEEGSEGPEPLAELGQQGRAAGKHLGVYFLYLWKKKVGGNDASCVQRKKSCMMRPAELRFRSQYISWLVTILSVAVLKRPHEREPQKTRAARKNL